MAGLLTPSSSGSQGIQHLGNGNGFIYVVDPDGNTIVRNLENDAQGAREARVFGLKGAALAINNAPYGRIDISGVSGSGNITSIKINGREQIGSNISYSASDELKDIAQAIANEINSYVDSPGSNNDYTASVYVGSGFASVNLIGDISIGADDNGTAINVTDTGNITTSSTDISGGTDGVEIYNEAIGYRFYLNADYDSAGCPGGATATEGDLSNSVEITKYIIQRGLQSAILTESVSVSGGGIAISRNDLITNISVDTESNAATDSLTSIYPKGFVDNDLVVLRGESANRVVSVNTNSIGNIVLQGDTNFKTGNKADVLVLQYNGGTFYEVSRSKQQIGDRSDYRNAGYPFPVEGSDDFTIPSSGTVEFDPAVDEKWQTCSNTVTLTGTVDVEFKTSTATKGDTFIVEYNANVTLNGNTLNLNGTSINLVDASNGGLVLYAYYNGTSWESYINKDLTAGAGISGLDIDPTFSAPPSLTEDSLKTDLVTQNLSFETNEQGDMVLEIPYKADVEKITVAVTKAIAGTEDGSITFKDNGGSSMGSVTVTQSSTIGTTFTLSPSSNNSFNAGDLLTATTSKTTTGGKMEVSYKFVKQDA